MLILNNVITFLILILVLSRFLFVPFVSAQLGNSKSVLTDSSEEGAGGSNQTDKRLGPPKDIPLEILPCPPAISPEGQLEFEAALEETYESP